MTLFDTHTHLYLSEFDADGHRCAVNRAIEVGVNRMMLPNVDLSTIEPMLRLHAAFPDNTFIAMGLHPTEVGLDSDDALAEIKSHLYASPAEYKAVGEVGIDLYWDKTYCERQMQAFEQQLNWAAELSLPVIIHCRDGLNEALEVISGIKAPLSGVFHSFGGTTTDVERILSAGDFFIGINGIVTFKNSSLRAVIPTIPTDRIVLETDSPYLAPVPYRGKRNESAYIIKTAEAVATALGQSFDAIADLTSRNAERLFKISEPESV